jgi:hypothetical protein
MNNSEINSNQIILDIPCDQPLTHETERQMIVDLSIVKDYEHLPSPTSTESGQEPYIKNREILGRDDYLAEEVSELK